MLFSVLSGIEKRSFICFRRVILHKKGQVRPENLKFSKQISARNKCGALLETKNLKIQEVGLCNGNNTETISDILNLEN